MSLFNFFKRKKTSALDSTESYEDFSKRLLSEFSEEDFLGKAAAARDKARAAKAVGNFDAAWNLYQEMKGFYLRHADRCNFTAAQTLAIDSSVSQFLADILRLEGKHHDALVHIIYWVASSESPTKAQQQKLKAYFSRCKFQSIGLSELHSFIESLRPLAEFMKIRNAVAAWRDAEGPSSRCVKGVHS